MHIVNIHEAKTHLSRIVERAADGEEIVIAKAGRPLVRLVSCKDTPSQRTPGLWKGKVRIKRGFDKLPASLASAFRGEDR